MDATATVKAMYSRHNSVEIRGGREALQQEARFVSLALQRPQRLLDVARCFRGFGMLPLEFAVLLLLLRQLLANQCQLRLQRRDFALWINHEIEARAIFAAQAQAHQNGRFIPLEMLAHECRGITLGRQLRSTQSSNIAATEQQLTVGRLRLRSTSLLASTLQRTLYMRNSCRYFCT